MQNIPNRVMYANESSSLNDYMNNLDMKKIQKSKWDITEFLLMEKEV